MVSGVSIVLKDIFCMEALLKFTDFDFRFDIDCIDR